MGQVLKAFFALPMTKVGIATAVLFQLIFSVVWMTGYDGVNDHADQLRVAVVNEDAGFGAAVADALAAQLPFQVEAVGDLANAQSRLNERDVQMVVHIPADFSAAVSAPESRATLHYYINESNPVTIKNMMAGAASQVTTTVNAMAAANGVKAALVRLQLPEAQAVAMAEGLTTRVESDVVYSNPVASLASQMVPMMMVLASYVGSMLLAMNLEQSSMALASRFGKWERFGARQMINVGTAIVVGLFGVSFVTLFGGSPASVFLELWGFQSLFLFAFMSLAQIFLLLFGPGGMVFNIILLSAQLVSSGAMVPRELLSGFYRSLGDFMPATYAVEGLMDLLFGGPSVAGVSVSLLTLIAICLAAGVGATAIRRMKTSPRAAAA
ncbi:ABC transporter permease [Paenibacillus sp.]|uniref:YhgE/Pip domain-containing protein n=1 Tax=Paenibacillus sp. TaxID=58172 RepID=UPI002811B955|nr:ABC transporter permease [Paenibacillus sp.]